MALPINPSKWACLVTGVKKEGDESSDADTTKIEAEYCMYSELLQIFDTCNGPWAKNWKGCSRVGPALALAEVGI